MSVIAANYHWQKEKSAFRALTFSAYCYCSETLITAQNALTLIFFQYTDSCDYIPCFIYLCKNLLQMTIMHNMQCSVNLQIYDTELCKVCQRTTADWVGKTEKTSLAVCSSINLIYCPHSSTTAAAIDQFLLPAGPTAANPDRRTYTVAFHRPCSAYYAAMPTTN